MSWENVMVEENFFLLQMGPSFLQFVGGLVQKIGTIQPCDCFAVLEVVVYITCYEFQKRVVITFLADETSFNFFRSRLLGEVHCFHGTWSLVCFNGSMFCLWL